MITNNDKYACFVSQMKTRKEFTKVAEGHIKAEFVVRLGISDGLMFLLLALSMMLFWLVRPYRTASLSKAYMDRDQAFHFKYHNVFSKEWWSHDNRASWTHLCKE